MAIKRSVYDTAKRIIDEKGKWHTAKSKGEDTSPYANAAVPYYQQLENNGAGDIAEKLRNSDYTQALDYLNTLEVEEDPVDYATQLNDFRKGVNAKSDKTFSTIETDKNALSKDYDDYISYLKEGYTGKDYANTLLNQYNEMGQRASLGELAGTGAENAGNIDSYAKAQAQRQQLAYANAGNAAALDQYNAIMGNYRAGLEGKSGMTAGAWGAMQENTSSDQGLFSDMYKSFIAGEADKEVAKQNALVAEYEARTAASTATANARDKANAAYLSWMKDYMTNYGEQPDSALASQMLAKINAMYGLGTAESETVDTENKPLVASTNVDIPQTTDTVTTESQKYDRQPARLPNTPNVPNVDAAIISEFRSIANNTKLSAKARREALEELAERYHDDISAMNVVSRNIINSIYAGIKDAPSREVALY